MKKAALILFALAVLSAGCDTCNTRDSCDGYPCIDDQPPGVPTGVRTITGDTYVIVEWDPVRVDDIQGYGVYRNTEPYGEYTRIGDVAWDEETSFFDDGLTNGMTYYYAVDAYDIYGNESELSYETVDDTPRPEGIDFQWFTTSYDADESAIAILPFQYNTLVVTSYQSSIAQYYLTRDGQGILRIVPLGDNQLQDMGYTYSWDEISEAPEDGWVQSWDGVEVVQFHTYVLRTVNGFYGKIRVLSAGPGWIVADWAYQNQQWSTELAPRVRGS
jgi:hypothetical protein